MAVSSTPWRWRGCSVRAIGRQWGIVRVAGSLRLVREYGKRAPSAAGRVYGRGVWMRILIADDELMSRKLLQKTLERAGYEVTAVENGRMAVEQLCPANGPRLALLDWLMPDLDDPAVSPQVRKRNEQ